MSINTHVTKWIPLYGYTGLIPFWGSVVAHWYQFDASHIFTSYSLTILSFLAGALWFSAIGDLSNDAARWKLFAAIVVSLWAWVAMLLPIKPAILLFTAGFALIYWIECWSPIKNTYPAAYFRLRTHLTLGVVFAHIAFFWVV